MAEGFSLTEINNENPSGSGKREGKLGSIAETSLEWRKRPSELIKRCKGYVSHSFYSLQ